MECRHLIPQYDAQVADLVRSNLKAYGLNLPGTVYFDEGLDHLSDFYKGSHRAYYVLVDKDTVIGGIGLAEFQGFPECCELQKLYLRDEAEGCGLGNRLVNLIESKAREYSYKRVYLETHTNLQAAIHLYEKAGYREIPRPDCVVHSTMNRFYVKELDQVT